MLGLLRKKSEKNSSPFFSNMVRARAFNLSRPLIDTIKPYNFYCEHFWLRSFHSYISSVPLLLCEFRLTVRHCIYVLKKILQSIQCLVFAGVKARFIFRPWQVHIKWTNLSPTHWYGSLRLLGGKAFYVLSAHLQIFETCSRRDWTYLTLHLVWLMRYLFCSLFAGFWIWCRCSRVEDG